jgi:hypothetical protein
MQLIPTGMYVGFVGFYAGYVGFFECASVQYVILVGCVEKPSQNPTQPS